MLNLPAYRGRSQGRGSVLFSLPAQAVRIPEACCTATSPALPAVPGVEDALNATMAQRAELDCLIYNNPLSYADLILNGAPEEYLKNVVGSHGSEI